MNINATEIISAVTVLMIMGGLLSLVVSTVVEYFIKLLAKNMTTDQVRLADTVVSFVVTFIAMFLYITQYMGMSFTWLYILGSFAMSILVAIISMNGYDVIYSYVFNAITNIFATKTTESEDK